MAASPRVRQILSEVRELNDEKKAALEAELVARSEQGPYVLAGEHLRRAPMYWSARRQAFGAP